MGFFLFDVVFGRQKSDKLKTHLNWGYIAFGIIELLIQLANEEICFLTFTFSLRVYAKTPTLHNYFMNFSQDWQIQSHLNMISRLACFTSRIADLGPALTLGDVSRALPPGLVPTTALLVPPWCCPLDFSPYCPPPHHKAGAAPPLGSGAHDDDDDDLEEKRPPVSGRCPRNPPLTILPTASCRCAHQSERRLVCG